MKNLRKMTKIRGDLGKISKILSKIFVIFSISLLFFPISQSAEGGNDPISEEETESKAQEQSNQKSLFEEKVIVVARLPVDEEELAKVPASVTIITAEDIRKSGARTLQELVSDRAGIYLFDDVGNGVETTIDMRGFNEGTAMAVLLDGVRINEPDDNRVNLEQIPLSSIERIEIYRGSASSTFGAGALSGTINIVTTSIPIEDFLEIASSYGTDDTTMARVTGGLNLKNTGFLLDASRQSSEGFRENSDYGITDLFLKMGGSYAKLGALSLSFLYNTSSLGAPGSLTQAEMESDRYSSPFNKVDGSDEELRQLTLSIRKNFSDSRRLSANLFYRKNDIDTLTTGRWLMGFETSSSLQSSGVVSQYSFILPLRGYEITMATGFEFQLNSFSSDGFFTDEKGIRASSSPDSSNETDLARTGFFSQAIVPISRSASLLVGMRYDRDDLKYYDRILSEIDGDTSFSELSFKGGINIYRSEKSDIYLHYSQAFLPPTVYDLFAFPLFGSNPDLKPSRAENYELGTRLTYGKHARIQASIFVMDVEDEVIFVITDPVYFIGRNENVGKSRRFGFEIESNLLFSDCSTGFFNYAFIDAELRAGENSGKAIPLIPQNKIHAGFSYSWGRSKDYSVRVDGSYIGTRYLTGDDSNSMSPLDPYIVFNARITKKFKDFQIFVEGKNLLDEEYETRGITNGFDLFFTPARGRTVSAGIAWKTAM